MAVPDAQRSALRNPEILSHVSTGMPGNGLTRRGVLSIAWAGALVRGELHADSPHFWNQKPASQWTPEEIRQLLSDSPWAKTAVARATTSKPPDREPSGPWNEDPFPGSRRSSTQSGRKAASHTATVLWESAPPILEAVKLALPDEFADHYAIAVSGIPRQKKQAGPEDLKPLTMLFAGQAGGAKADLVQFKDPAANSLLFGFPRAKFRLSQDHREVRFSTVLGDLQIEVRFDPKEMLYFGQLAL